MSDINKDNTAKTAACHPWEKKRTVVFNPSENTVKYLPGEYSHNRCCYANCPTGKYTHKKRLFCFPSGQASAERFKAWIENSGNEKLRDLTPSTARSRRICEDHFDDSSFRTPERKGLTKRAVPLKNYPPHLSCKSMDIKTEPEINESFPDKNIGNSHETSPPITIKEEFDSRLFEDLYEDDKLPESMMYTSFEYLEPSDDEVTSPANSIQQILPKTSLPISTEKNSNRPTSPQTVSKSYCDHLEQTIKKLKNDLVTLRKMNTKMRQRFIKLLMAREEKRSRIKNEKRKQKNLKKQVEELVEQMDIAPAAKIIISLQIHPPNAPYTDEQKKFCQLLFQHSPSAFKKLREAGANFPGVMTIRRSLQTDSQVLEALSGSNEVVEFIN